MNSQEKVATSLGVLFKRVELPEDTSKEELLNTIDKLNEDKKVHGYGLKSIRRIVKKYDGSFQCDVVEEEVKISISFSNK